MFSAQYALADSYRWWIENDADERSQPGHLGIVNSATFDKEKAGLGKSSFMALDSSRKRGGRYVRKMGLNRAVGLGNDIQGQTQDKCTGYKEIVSKGLIHSGECFSGVVSSKSIEKPSSS